MNPIATIALEPDDTLSIPFKVHASADGTRLAVLNTFGMPYAQQLLVIDTETHQVVGRWRFEAKDTHLFNVDMQISGDGATVVMVGGILKDASGQDFEERCVLTCVDVAGGGMTQTRVGPVGFNFVSITPDGATAYVFHNGNDVDQVQHFEMFPVAVDGLVAQPSVTLDAPVNNLLYRPAEGRALLSKGREIVSLDLTDHTIGPRLAPRFNHPYLLAAFGPEEPLVYAAYAASAVVVKTIDITRREVIAQHSFSWDWSPSSNIVPFGADHLVFPPGSSAGAISLWNRHSGEIDARAGLPDHMVLSTPHPDGRHLILFDYHDRTLKVVPAHDVFASIPSV